MSEETKMILDAINGINEKIEEMTNKITKLEKEQNATNIKLDHLKNSFEEFRIENQINFLQNRKDHNKINQDLDTVIEILKEHDLLHMN